MVCLRARVAALAVYEVVYAIAESLDLLGLILDALLQHSCTEDSPHHSQHQGTVDDDESVPLHREPSYDINGTRRLKHVQVPMY